MRDSPTDDHKNGDVVLVDGQSFVGRCVHLVGLLLSQIVLRQAIVNRTVVFALRVFLNELLAEGNLLVDVLRSAGVGEGFEGLFFLGINLGRLGGGRRTGGGSRGLCGRGGLGGLLLLLILRAGGGHERKSGGEKYG